MGGWVKTRGRGNLIIPKFRVWPGREWRHQQGATGGRWADAGQAGALDCWAIVARQGHGQVAGDRAGLQASERGEEPFKCRFRWGGAHRERAQIKWGGEFWRSKKWSNPGENTQKEKLKKNFKL